MEWDVVSKASAPADRPRENRFVMPGGRRLFARSSQVGRQIIKGLMTPCLLLGIATAATAAPVLQVEPITWDVIGLDSNQVNSGPNEYPVGARVRNTGDAAATNLVVRLHWMTTNSFINLTPAALGTTDTLTLPSLPPGGTALFYFNVTVTRTPAAHFTTRRFRISSEATGVSPVFGPLRELFVEKILSQSRNDVLGFTGPDTLKKGDVAQFVLSAKTATNGYEQLQVFINFPNEIFRIRSIQAQYSAPKPNGFLNSIDYANACGWDANPNSPTYRSCIGPCLTISCKTGGTINTVYTVEVIKNIETTVSLSTLIHDFSGSSYHYNSDFGISKVIRPSNDLAVVKTAVPDEVEAGDTFQYIISAVNLSGEDSENVTLTDTIPTGLTFISANPPQNSGPDPLVWNLGTVPSGTSVDTTVTVRANCSVIPAGSQSVTLINTATVASSTDDPNPDNNLTTESVLIQDTTPPDIACPPDQSVNNDPGECSADVNVGTPLSADLCGTSTLIGERDDELALGDPYPVGTTVITWTVTDNHTNQTSCTQQITVADNEDPTLTCPADIVTSADQGMCSAIVDPGVPASEDNCATSTLDSERSDGLELTDPFPVGMTTITWTVTDVHGNTAQCSHTVAVIDDDSLTISCPPDILVSNDPGLCSAELNPGVPLTDDNCGTGTLDSERSDGLELTDPYPVGTTTITWTVTDINGNVTSCTQSVTVLDNEDPAITCPADINTSADQGLCSADVDPGVPVTDDNCATSTLDFERSDGLALDDPYPVGTTTITWTVTDIHGNDAQCTQTVVITDEQAPQITCPADICENAVRAQCSASIDPGMPDASDNCTSVSVLGEREDQLPLSDPYPLGTTLITWTATDDAGNATSCTQSITYGVIQCPTAPGSATRSR